MLGPLSTELYGGPLDGISLAVDGPDIVVSMAHLVSTTEQPTIKQHRYYRAVRVDADGARRVVYVHPTINVDRLDEQCQLRGLVINEAREIGAVRYILNNSFGMLGINSVVIIEKI